MNLIKEKYAWVLCPEGTIVKIFSPPPPPCIKSTHCFRVVCIRGSNIRCKKIIWVGLCFILFGLNVICFGIMLPTFVLYTLMGLKYIGKPFTVKNSPWKKRDILLGPCLGMTAR